MKTYRAGIVGCGRIASLFAEDKKRSGIVTHAQAYQSHPRTSLVAACDIDPKALSQFGKRWQVNHLYDSVDEMLRNERLELLSVCVPDQFHGEVVEKAARAGVRGIVCEKPIADTLVRADRMLALCCQKRIPLLVNHTRRFISLYHRVKRMISSGELGRIQAVSCYYTAGILNTATHLFDFLRFFFGDVAWVWADPDRILRGNEKSFSGYLYFKKGFGASLAALDVRSYLIFEADIYGTKKRVRLIESGTELEIWEAAPNKIFSGYSSLQKTSQEKGDMGEGVFNLIKNLVECVEKRASPSCSGHDGLASLEIAAALSVSARRDGVRVKLPLKKRAFKIT